MAERLALEVLQIATPCPADWADMTGDNRVRFCPQCRMNVYNVESMTRDEAEAMIAAREGRTCLRMFKRADGTIITKDCPVGLAAAARWAKRKLIAAAVLLIAMLCAPIAWAMSGASSGSGRAASGGAGPGVFSRLVATMRATPMIGELIEWIDPTPPPPMMMLGDVCPTVLPSPAPAPTPAP